jgi:uncharacterized protein (TIGR00296 family)
LSAEEKRQLLHIARTVIEHRVRGREIPAFQVSSETLKEERGLFVTLHKGGALRGCIGYIQGIKPLYLAVTEMAEAAAFQDPRFPPVSLESEVGDLRAHPFA